MTRSPPRHERHAIELLEEAVHLLRLSPASLISTYYLGSLPFVLGFLFFWTDMSQSAFARERITSSAFVVGLLFCWMKLWQTVFAKHLFGRISGRPVERWTWSRLVRVAVGQTILQPSGLFLLPIAAIVTLPFGWVYAFYQSVTVLGGNELELKRLRREAVRQTQVWPGQNHLLLAFFSMGALFVFLNLGLACFLVPSLIKMLFGIETVFTRHAFGMLNSTLLMAVTGLTYLSLDPVIKAVYALRCFYGQAIGSGEDLKAELRSLPNWRERSQTSEPVKSQRANFVTNESMPNDRAGEGVSRQGNLRVASMLASAAFSALLFVPAAISAPVQERVPTREAELSRQSPSIPAPELDRALESVLTRREFSWRMPRAKGQLEEESGWLMSFLRSGLDMARDWVQTILRFGKKIFEWLREKLFNKLRSPLPASGAGTGWMTSLHLLLYCLIALVVAVLAVMALRMWRRRASRTEEVLAMAIPAAPDLTDENLLADQLPEEGWLKLGRELMDRGELRLALRALYLAGLAHLGRCDLVGIARFKSNRDYELELHRRAQTRPDLVSAFSQAVCLFDRVWYGRHEITRADLNGFQTTLERITAC